VRFEGSEECNKIIQSRKGCMIVFQTNRLRLYMPSLSYIWFVRIQRIAGLTPADRRRVPDPVPNPIGVPLQDHIPYITSTIYSYLST
jgi:hypothetical protein